jgi:hypothetical protein
MAGRINMLHKQKRAAKIAIPRLIWNTQAERRKAVSRPFGLELWTPALPRRSIKRDL